MPFLLDHCVWRQTFRALSEAGFSSVTLRELGRTEAKNSEVLALAKERGAIFVTRDRDFTDMSRYPLGTHAGIVWLDITPTTLTQVHQVLCQALKVLAPEQLNGALLTVTHTTYRLRRPSQGEGRH